MNIDIYVCVYNLVPSCENSFFLLPKSTVMITVTPKNTFIDYEFVPLWLRLPKSTVMITVTPKNTFIDYEFVPL